MSTKTKKTRPKTERLGLNVNKFVRGEKNDTKKVGNLKHKSKLKKVERDARIAAEKAARSEILLPSDAGFLEAEGVEKTYKFTQKQIKQNVDPQTAQKIFDLTFNDWGEYNVNFSQNGRFLALAAQKGHVAVLDWMKKRPLTEFHVKETVRDITFLHNHTFFATAQRKYVYIYDHQGTEIHCLKDHVDTNRLTFLPHHFLLVSVGNTGCLRYHDTSTGELKADLKTKMGPCDTLAQNPSNAIIHTGHSNGVVALWTPNLQTPVVKMLAHKGRVAAIGVDRSGNYMATSGIDGLVKVWDLRKYEKLHQFRTPRPVSSISISQQGLLGLGAGPHVQVLKNAFSTTKPELYMSELLGGRTVRNVRFCPFEDVLGVGHSGGYSNLVVPGAGDPNFDTFEANPFETASQRREGEVHKLLEKLQPEMITLDVNTIGTVLKDPDTALEEKKEQMRAANKEEKKKNRARGRNKIQKRLKRKQQNVVDQKRVELQEALAKKKEEAEQKKNPAPAVEYSALSRFS